MGLMEIRRRMLADNASHEIPEWVSEGPDDVVSFESDWAVPMKSLKVAIDPVQDLSHGDPSPTNICPISGWTGAQVVRTGFNVWDEEWENGYITNGIEYNSSACIRSKNYNPVVPNKTYYLYCGSATNMYFVRPMFYDASKNFIANSAWCANGTFTTPVNCRFIRLTTQSGTSATYGGTYNHDISINYPATDHDYHAYAGNTYSVSWETEVGTVYGGTLDVVSGELVVDRASVDLGTLNWGAYDKNGRFITRDIVGRAANANMATSQYTLTATVFANMPNGTFRGTINDPTLIVVCDTRFTSAGEFKTAMNGVQLVYELAEPITYHLTPQEVRTLLGQNNVWADTGNSTVEYYKRISELVNS